MIKNFYLIILLQLFSLFCEASYCLAQDNQMKTITAEEQDEVFKKSVAKVIFFLSILGMAAYLLKKHNLKGKSESKLLGAIQLVDETSIRGTKFTLLEVLGKKILVATNQSGSLEMIDLKNEFLNSNIEMISSESFQKNRANLS
jgi:hypothetical protein